MKKNKDVVFELKEVSDEQIIKVKRVLNDNEIKHSKFNSIIEAWSLKTSEDCICKFIKEYDIQKQDFMENNKDELTDLIKNGLDYYEIIKPHFDWKCE